MGNYDADNGRPVWADNSVSIDNGERWLTSGMINNGQTFLLTELPNRRVNSRQIPCHERSADTTGVVTARID